MADEQNEQSQFEKDTRYEVKKPLLQAFKELFNRQGALPEGEGSKHKTTSVDMKTSMNLREFRSNIIEKVGNFFQALSKIGSPKKDENLNQFKKETIGSKKEASAIEQTKGDEQTVQAHEQLVFAGNILGKENRGAPSQRTVILAETTTDIEPDNSREGSDEKSSEDLVEEPTNKEKNVMSTGEIHMAEQPQAAKINPDLKPKNIIVSGSVQKDTKNINKDEGPEL